MTKKLIVPFLLILLAFNSCNSEKAKSKAGILSEKTMAELLVDTHITDAILYLDTARADDKRDKALYYYPSVLEKYGITQAQMDSSVAWYMRNPEAYARIYEQVIKDLEKRKAAEPAKPITE